MLAASAFIPVAASQPWLWPALIGAAALMGSSLLGKTPQSQTPTQAPAMPATGFRNQAGTNPLGEIAMLLQKPETPIAQRPPLSQSLISNPLLGARQFGHQVTGDELIKKIRGFM